MENAKETTRDSARESPRILERKKQNELTSPRIGERKKMQLKSAELVRTSQDQMRISKPENQECSPRSPRPESPPKSPKASPRDAAELSASMSRKKLLEVRKSNVDAKSRTSQERKEESPRSPRPGSPNKTSPKVCSLFPFVFLALTCFKKKGVAKRGKHQHSQYQPEAKTSENGHFSASYESQTKNDFRCW